MYRIKKADKFKAIGMDIKISLSIVISGDREIGYSTHYDATKRRP